MNPGDLRRGEQPDTAPGFWRTPIRFLFGFDVFISYGRSDADGYAELLETKLEALGFATFRDKREIDAGVWLNDSLKNAIRRSRHFVLLDTPAARRSPWVASEVETYLRFNRKRLTRILKQGVRDPGDWIVWENAEIGKRLEGFVWIEDTADAFALGHPSDDVVEQIRKGFRTVRLRNLMRFTTTAVIASLFGLLMWSVQQTREARRQARVATARELISASLLKQDSDPELSMILAMYAVAATWPSGHTVLPEAEQRLHVALTSSRVRLTVRHSDSVNAVAWSPDGRRLATGSADSLAKIWDAGDGRELSAMAGHTESVNSIAWSPDGRYLATAGFDNTVKVWKADTGTELMTLRGHKANVRSVAWSPDGTRLVTGSEDHTARIWDAATGKSLLTLRGQGDSFTTVIWSPDGHKLATASHENAAKVWDATTGKELVTLRGHTGTVMTIAWDLEGKKLATGALDGVVYVWNATSGARLFTLTEKCSIDSVSWSLDSSRLAAACSDGNAVVWDVSNVKAEGEAQEPASSQIGQASSPEDEQGDTSLKGFSQVVPFTSELGKRLLVLRGHTESINSVSWNRDGKRLATGSDDHTARVWETGSSSEFLALNRLGTVLTVAVSPDGKRFATGSSRYDNAAEVWDSANGSRLFSLPGHSDQINSIAWSPDGLRLATGSKDRTAKLWDAENGRELLTLNGHDESVTSVAWSPDGKQVATGSLDNTARIWDISTGKELRTLRGHSESVDSVAWSPNGKELATGGADDVAKIWDIETGKEILSLTGGDGSPSSVAWSPDGSQLAMGSGSILKVWRLPAGKEVLTRKNDDNVMAVAWSHDGRRLAAGVGSLLKVWDARNGEELLALPNDSQIYSMGWFPGDRRLIDASQDGSVHVYAMDIRDLITLARRHVTRKLTQDECQTYFHTSECPPLPALSD